MGFSGMTTVSDFTAHQTATAVVARKGTAGPRPSAVDAPATLTDEHGDVYVEPGLTPLAAREANRSALSACSTRPASATSPYAARSTTARSWASPKRTVSVRSRRCSAGWASTRDT